MWQAVGALLACLILFIGIYAWTEWQRIQCEQQFNVPSCVYVAEWRPAPPKQD